MLKVTIIAMGHKMPAWVVEAMSIYKKRLQDKMSLSIVEIPLQQRTKATDLSKIMEKERLMMIKAIPANAYLIGLTPDGKLFTSEQLAEQLSRLLQHESHLCFLIGGPEGLLPALVETCHETWSLSKLTFTHSLARIVLLESLYRTFTIFEGHPYHK